MTGQDPLPDPYAVLGISRRASSADISRAYRRLARELHPDSRPAEAGAADRLRSVMAAHELLSDPIRRAAFDGRAIDHAISPSEAPAPRIFASSAASQLHPLSPADTTHGVRSSPPGAAIRPGPVRVEPLPATDSSPSGDALTLEDLQLLGLIGYHLGSRRQWPW